MIANAELHEAIDGRLSELLDRARKQLASRGLAPLPRPQVRLFDDRLDAGRALPPSRYQEPGTIELNAVYLSASRQEMLEDTLAHELAHLLVFHLSPARRHPPHGQLWRQVMSEWFGVKPERTHRFPTDGVQTRRQRRWQYRCHCGPHELTTIRHRRVLRGTVYLCRRCRQPLQREYAQ